MIYVEVSRLCRIQSMDLTGRVLISSYSYKTNLTIDIASLGSGLYLIKINGQYVQKFIKD